MEIVFFTGKGGVGKSTNSAIFALKKAQQGSQVLLNSIDPAHNLHDIFHMKFKQKPIRVIDRLQVMETDLNFWVKRYLSQTEQAFKDLYRYMEAFNLHKYFSILKYSPGIEEYAVLLALEDAIRNNPKMDYIVFDTPPTALTLRFLSLPKVSLLWLRELLSFRQQILDKKEIVTRIKRGTRTVEQDPVLSRIEELIVRYEGLAALFSDHTKTQVVIVLNQDQLSLSESKDIYRELEDLGMSVPRIIVNKFNGDLDIRDTIAKHFKNPHIDVFPLLSDEPTGLDRIASLSYPVPLNIPTKM